MLEPLQGAAAVDKMTEVGQYQMWRSLKVCNRVMVRRSCCDGVPVVL